MAAGAERRPAGVARLALAGMALLVLGGCEGTGALKTASLVTSVSLGNHSSSHSESTHEIYARVARGSKACWFGASKPLDKTYIFDAEVAPESEGGAAEVAVHVRTPEQPNPRGGKVFIVSITKVADGSNLVTESRRIPETLAHSMRADVARWARTGTVECGMMALPEDRTAAADAPPPVVGATSGPDRLPPPAPVNTARTGPEGPPPTAALRGGEPRMNKPPASVPQGAEAAKPRTAPLPKPRPSAEQMAAKPSETAPAESRPSTQPRVVLPGGPAANTEKAAEVTGAVPSPAAAAPAVSPQAAPAPAAKSQAAPPSNAIPPMPPMQTLE